MMKRLCLILLVAVCLFACNRQRTFIHDYQSPSNAGWSALDTLHFTLQEVDEDADCNISVGLRLQNNFPYEGIWIVLESHLENPTQFHRDTLYCKTADKNGMPIGTGVAVQQMEIPFTEIHLHKGQAGDFRLYHIMRREVVPNISDVGLFVKEKKKD